MKIQAKVEIIDQDSGIVFTSYTLKPKKEQRYPDYCLTEYEFPRFIFPITDEMVIFYQEKYRRAADD